MEKLLYIALTNFEDPAEGVAIKVHSQIKGLEECGYDVYCAAYGTEGIYLYNRQEKALLQNYGNVHRRVLLLSALLRHLKEQEYGICYIRFPYIDWWLKQIIKELKRHHATIYIEVSTYPIHCPSLREDGIAAVLLYRQHKFFSRGLNKYVEKVLYIGNKTDRIFGCTAEAIPNGCDVERYKMMPPMDANREEIVLIAVAGMFAHHGYERLLGGMADYYRNGRPEKVVKVYMVGDGPMKENYQKAVIENGLIEHIHFTGVKSGEELDALFEHADIAVGPLGLYKENCYQASTLKVKEYLSRGIPFIYACEEIALSAELPYALKVENRPGNLDMGEVLKFWDKIRNEDFRINMRAYAQEHYAWVRIYQKALAQGGDLKESI